MRTRIEWEPFGLASANDATRLIICAMAIVVIQLAYQFWRQDSGEVLCVFVPSRGALGGTLMTTPAVLSGEEQRRMALDV